MEQTAKRSDGHPILAMAIMVGTVLGCFLAAGMLIALLALTCGCSKKTTVIETIPEAPPVIMDVEKPIAEAPKPIIQEETVFKAPTTVYFAFDDATLSTAGAMAIDDFMASHKPDRSLILTGGACPIGSEDYNYRLGLRRAQSVEAYIAKTCGKPKTVHVLTVGENDLVTTDPERYELNRRCIIEEK